MTLISMMFMTLISMMFMMFITRMVNTTWSSVTEKLLYYMYVYCTLSSWWLFVFITCMYNQNDECKHGNCPYPYFRIAFLPSKPVSSIHKNADASNADISAWNSALLASDCLKEMYFNSLTCHTKTMHCPAYGTCIDHTSSRSVEHLLKFPQIYSRINCTCVPAIALHIHTTTALDHYFSHTVVHHLSLCTAQRICKLSFR